MVLVGRLRAPREDFNTFAGRPDRTNKWQQRLAFLLRHEKRLEDDWVQKQLAKHLEEFKECRTPPNPDDSISITQSQRRFWLVLKSIEKDALPKVGEESFLYLEYFQDLWNKPGDKSAQVPAITEAAKGVDPMPGSDPEPTSSKCEPASPSNSLPPDEVEPSVLVLPEAAPKTNEKPSHMNDHQMYSQSLKPEPRVPSARLSPGARVGRRVAINKHAYDTFEKLLSGSKSAQKISWQAFLDAMSQVNFNITNGSGSLVNFTSAAGSKWAGQPTIGFYKPHPASGWTRAEIRSVGMTLRSRLGITINTFILV
ncbi:hypothetical protein DL98DRAFT_584997 [Cadophora sp. DSE1049]|nr:hypothetical protein DL98DRAFT_584997 [Cadophora sp. DSE1049]